MSNSLAKEIILSLTDQAGVSGYEEALHPHLQEIFRTLADRSYLDFLGNHYSVKDGFDSRHTIMLAAHMDEIGLIVTHIDKRGFIHFAAVGGIDQRTLLFQEVIVHGKQEVIGIICFDPMKKDIEKGKAIDLSDLAIDTGYQRSDAIEIITPGDIISFIRKPLMLLNERISGKALDDRAGVAVMAVCLHELRRMTHKHDVIAVATVQEEVGLRGATTSANRLQPTIAIAIDVTHAQALDTKSQIPIQLSKGPVISLGPNIHDEVYSRLVNSAHECRIPVQIQPIAGPTGTDARILQLTGSGIPTGLVSIPLRYMHTSVETLSLKDVTDCGKLLANFISTLPDNLEEILCC